MMPFDGFDLDGNPMSGCEASPTPGLADGAQGASLGAGGRLPCGSILNSAICRTGHIILRRHAAMKLNYLNFTVADPVETQRFLVKHFGLKPMGKSIDTISFCRMTTKWCSR